MERKEVKWKGGISNNRDPSQDLKQDLKSVELLKAGYKNQGDCEIKSPTNVR